MFTAIGIALKFARAKLALIPAKVWIALAIIAAIAGLIWWHNHAVSKARAEGYQAGKVDTEARYKAKADEWVKQIGEIAAKIRSRNHEANVRIVERAGALIVRGPGKAACTNSTATGAGGSQSRSGGADAGLDRLPEPERVDLIGVPFAELVERAKVCDLNRQEVKDRREYDAKLLEWWKKASK